MPPRPVSSFQPVQEVFRPISGTGTLNRVWRFLPRSQTWLFYDPDPGLGPFNTMRNVDLGADPPNVVTVGVTKAQRFRGVQLFPGWNVIPLTQQPLVPTPSAGIRTVQQIFQPLIRDGSLERVWWLDSRSQRWTFFDPEPELAAFNTLTTVNLAAATPMVLSVNVSRQTNLRGRTLYPGWNYVVVR